MKKIYTLFGALLITAACSTDLDQAPTNIASADSLSDFEGVLNAAYWYQTGSTTPLAIMGDFRSDNALFDESPHDEFDDFDGGVVSMEGDFFRPFYSSLYKSILSANSVIDNSDDATQVAEAKFLRALSYSKLVKVFGGVTLNLSPSPSTTDQSILARSSAADVYLQIETDLADAISVLDNAGLSTGRATRIAAQALLGKVHLAQGDASSAESVLASVVNGASAAGISLLDNFSAVFASDLNAEIIFATQLTSSIGISDYSGDTFNVWYAGGNTKADEIPVSMELINAYTDGDTRKNVTVDAAIQVSNKYQTLGADQDWIEIRFADVLLMYAEALNEGGNTAGAATQLNKVRNRAGLSNTTASSQAALREAIQHERRLELAFEGHHWFDLVRTGTVDAEMGQSINSNYYVFPIPTSEIFASDEVITQNPGY